MAMGEHAATGLGRFVFLSGVVHLVLLGTVLASSQLARLRRAPPQTVMITKLVRLGVERPPEYLPRKVEPLPPPAKPVPAVAPKSEPAVAPPNAKALPSAKERLSELSQVSKALERLKKQGADDAEGHPDGVPEGEATNLAQAIAGQKFYTEVYSCIKSNYAIEGIDPSRVRNRSARVAMRVAGDGRIIEHQIEATSGLEAFDRAVERAVVRCGRVSPPPVALREQLQRDGIELVFQP